MARCDNWPMKLRMIKLYIVETDRGDMDFARVMKTLREHLYISNDKGIFQFISSNHRKYLI